MIFGGLFFLKNNTSRNSILTIIETFKTWRYYLKDSKYKILVFTYYNNLRRFIDTKNLSSRQVCWTQKLLKHHFQIHYCQGKAKRAIDVLSQLSQLNVEEKTIFRAKNTQISHHL